MSWTTTNGEDIRIKICGVRHEVDIDAAVAAGADAIGLIRCQGSPRHVDRDRASRLAKHCGDAIVPVTLLVNPTPEDWLDLPTIWVQLHGQETPQCVTAASAQYSVIKAVPAHDSQLVQAFDDHEGVQRLLIDAPQGGSGELFDHDSLALLRHAIRTPLIIAGGLNSTNVAKAVATLQPWGVDVSSGVESTRGTKDATLIKAFCKAARSHFGDEHTRGHAADRL